LYIRVCSAMFSIGNCVTFYLNRTRKSAKNRRFSSMLAYGKYVDVHNAYACVCMCVCVCLLCVCVCACVRCVRV